MTEGSILQKQIAPAAFLRGFGLVLLVAFMAWQGVRFADRLIVEQSDRLDGVTEQTALEDYVVFYTAGRMVLDGEASHLYDLGIFGAKEQELLGRPVGIDGTLAYFNPPFVAAALAAPALLDVGPFSLAFLIFSIVLVLIVMHWLSRILQLGGWKLVVFWIGVLSLKGTFWLLIQGQLSMLLLLGWTGFAFFHMREQPRMSGLFLALTLVKPQMVLPFLLVLVWKRQWETLRSFSVVAGGLVAISIAVSGPSVLIDYPVYLLDSTGFDGKGILTGNMYGLNGLVARITGDQTPSMLTMSLVYIPLIGVIAHAWWRAGDEALRADFPALFAMTLLASMLLNPHLYLQDLTLLVVITAFSVAHLRTRGQGMGIWPVLAVLMWLFQFYTHRLAEELNLNLLTPLMLVMFCATYLQLRNRSAEKAVMHDETMAAKAEARRFPIATA